jgi:hypothetical protein
MADDSRENAVELRDEDGGENGD